jgi:hypothetical protein
MKDELAGNAPIGDTQPVGACTDLDMQIGGYRHVGVCLENDQIFVEHAILEGEDLRQLELLGERDHNVRTRLGRGHFGDVKLGTRRGRVQRLFTPTVVGKRVSQAFAADGHRAWSSPHPRGVSDVDAARPICATRCDPAVGAPGCGTTTDS